MRLFLSTVSNRVKFAEKYIVIFFAKTTNKKRKLTAVMISREISKKRKVVLCDYDLCERFQLLKAIR